MAASVGPRVGARSRDRLPVLLADSRRVRDRRSQGVLHADWPVRHGHARVGRREHRARLPHVDVWRARRHRHLLARRPRLQGLPLQVRRRPRGDRREEPDAGR